MDQLIYTPGIFDQNSIAAAKQVILTVPLDIADEFWRRATVATGDLIMEAMRPTRDDVLLDFGCGIGRLAKELIGRTGCRIVGVDISDAMRRYATEYVASDRFSVLYCSMFLSRRANSGVLLQPAPPTRHFSYITASIVVCRATKVGSTTVKISASLRQRSLTFSVNTKCREICSCIPTKVLCRARLKDTGSGCFEINLTPEVQFCG